MSAESLTENLRAELEKTNAAFARWADRKEEWLANSSAEHERTMEESQRTLESLRESEMGLDQQRLVGGQRSAQLQGELEHNQAQFAALASRKEYILSQLAEAAEATRREEQSLESLQSQHDHSRAFLEKSYNDLTLGIRNFLWLGLDLQKAPGNSMRFVFTQVDPKNPAREFSFQMYVDESDTYQLLDCSPALPSTTLAQIMNTLNQDNDITRFTVSMRREFVRHM